MWGSLARGITERAADAASAAAAAAVPAAGDLLARVGEVVAPPLDDGEGSYYDDEGSYYEDEEGEFEGDQVNFEGESDDDDDGDEGTPNLDRYRNKKRVSKGVTAETAPASGNSLVNGLVQSFSEDKDDSAAAMEEEEMRLQREAEERRLRVEKLAQEKMEQERLARMEAERLERERQEAEAKAQVEEAAREVERERLERERVLEEKRQRSAAAEAAEKKRLEEEARIAEETRLEEERAAAAQAEAEAERMEQERLAAEEAKQAERARLEEEERMERERIGQERMLAEKRQQEEEDARRRAEEEIIERERLAAADAARQAKLERLEKERIEQARLLEEQRRAAEAKAEAEQREKQRLAASEAERADQARLEEERIEQERRLEEQRQEEAVQRQQEEALQRAREEEAAAAEAAQRAESERVHQERQQRLEIERVAAEEKARATEEEGARAAAHEAQLAGEVQSQKTLLEKVNSDARETADQLAQVQQEREQLQGSNDELQTTCEQLKTDLHRAAETISKLRETVADQEEKERQRWEQEAQRVEEEESSILAAAKLDMEMQMTHLKESLEGQIQSLELELVEERRLSGEQQRELQQRLEEATARLSTSETEVMALAAKKEAKASKKLQASEKAAAKAVALLDEKDEEVQQLQKVIADMREAMKKNKVDADEAEEEMDELHHENEDLHQQLETVQAENKAMKSRLASSADDSEKLGGLKMELQMLEEERRREKNALESAHEKTSEDHAVVLSERDAAKAQARDLEQLLAAARADLDLANTDRDRALTANENLQRALEDFQGERDAEMALLSEQQTAAEEALAAAHAASLEATKEACAAEMRDVQYAADKSVQNTLVEMDKMEATIQECRKDSMNLRKALDEAIARLQTNQEDVVDRSLIKNVILDWHSKKGKAKRDVMVLLGSILHFTEDEKDKASIGEGHGSLDKIYGAVAAPLPPSKLDVDKIEGDTVREQFVNFLLAETGEEDEAGGEESA